MKLTNISQFLQSLRPRIRSREEIRALIAADARTAIMATVIRRVL